MSLPKEPRGERGQVPSSTPCPFYAEPQATASWPILWALWVADLGFWGLGKASLLPGRDGKGRLPVLSSLWSFLVPGASLRLSHVSRS